ncbi:hypothetical protein PV08_03888 [Exophiala spinifera]|uniref:U4/U6.U5 small nuclear ribonucleoprotein 27kDa protein domain-containing protein n=1 Tax=Exophiala spinifera TaxID=91928 RepID=A0A0D2BDJ8_9EURO|nr:uncharacterized protein PV08_03888 [Exophiala spinifera]KIW16700.1 hypothetical protein PV08_03888 [Exophiala spinifera]
METGMKDDVTNEKMVTETDRDREIRIKSEKNEAGRESDRIETGIEVRESATPMVTVTGTGVGVWRDQRSRKHSRSRSPVRDGANGSIRTRSPPRRSDHDRGRNREPAKVEDTKSTHNTKHGIAGSGQPSVNGDRMAVDEDDEDALLRNMMGFTTFKSTQNTKVPGNQIYGVRKEKKTEYRQYMNRVGGFNRPLSPSR